MLIMSVLAKCMYVNQILVIALTIDVRFIFWSDLLLVNSISKILN